MESGRQVGKELDLSLQSAGEALRGRLHSARDMVGKRELSYHLHIVAAESPVASSAELSKRTEKDIGWALISRLLGPLSTKMGANF